MNGLRRAQTSEPRSGGALILGVLSFLSSFGFIGIGFLVSKLIPSDGAGILRVMRDQPGMREGEKIRIVWEKGVFSRSRNLEKRVKEECCILYLLAKRMGLPERIWKYDLLVVKEEKGKGDDETASDAGHYLVVRVDDVFLRFFNEGGKLEDIVEDPGDWSFFWQPSCFQAFLSPYVDPEKKKVFALLYKIRVSRPFSSLEKAAEAMKRCGSPGNIFPPPRGKNEHRGTKRVLPIWEKTMFVQEDWFEGRILRTIRPPVWVHKR